ncbi:MAG: hypothetical protein JWM11_3913, partial [Planctomycetaceae bacterium]|nr:hypothetical protein [Planctomycetaceae bacterium]
MPLFPGRPKQLFRDVATVAWLPVALAAILTIEPGIQIRAAQDESAAKVDSKKTITEQEANEFADRLTEVILQGDKNGYQALVNWQGNFNRDADVPKLPGLMKQRQAFGELCATKIAAQIISDVKSGGSYTCIHIRNEAPKLSLIFRIRRGKDLELSYHQLFLSRTPNGKLFVNDIFVLQTAECVSESVRRQWMLLAHEPLRLRYAELSLPQDPLVENAAKIEKYLKLMERKQYAEALKFYCT